MSLLLDQRLVGEVADYCPENFLKYYKCLEGGDSSKCFQEQQELSACVKSTAPSFKKIIANCSDQMKIYENCIREHPDYKTRCFDKLADMRTCVKKTLVGDSLLEDISSSK